jgi:predicted dehydrogenase
VQIADFLRAIREGRPPLVTGEDGRAVVELFTAVYRSSRESCAVALPLPGEARDQTF